jgi:hypothetical protein
MNAKTQDLMDLIARTRQDFRFKYVGGGYFKDKHIPRGEKAEVRHGEEILDEFCQELIRTCASGKTLASVLRPGDDPGHEP